MAGGLIDSTAQVDTPDDRRIYGVAVAQVIGNIDQTNQGRVQLHLPWLPCIEPWARVAALMAGPDRGAYFIPQVGDEVLVAFENGNVNNPYIIGSLWNGRDLPPAKERNAPVDQRIIRTPKGHKVIFDDAKKTIEISHADGARLKFESQKIELVIGSTSITLNKDGEIAIKSKARITLEGESINIAANSNVDIGGKSSARIDGGSYFSVAATKIFIG
jgi:uncharacterized protein involved in type VI secretion and phage assembly